MSENALAPRRPVRFYATAVGIVSAIGIVAAILSGHMPAIGVLPKTLSTLIEWLPLLAAGFLMNIYISVSAMLIGTVLGIILGAGSVSKITAVHRVSWIITQIFRNSPWLVLIYMTTFLLPFEFSFRGTIIPFPDWMKATIGLALPAMANMAEILRGAIQSIPTGQWESARMLALSPAQIFRWIILPQCVRQLLPSWMNLYAVITMGTVLASIVGVSDVLMAAQQAANVVNKSDFSIAVYLTVLAAFFVYCYPISYLTSRLEQRWRMN